VADVALARMRRRVALAVGACAALLAPALLRPAPRLVWNASASVATGLYLVSPGAAAERGDIVVVRLPAAARSLAAARHYLPSGVPLLKPVGAVGGDAVCASGASLAIGGVVRAARLAQDANGRRLPWWRGCRSLTAGELFLLGTMRPDSFDSRYFGPVDEVSVIGTARLLWAR
jgi:conjugative transfer signal peptidase TraF